MTRLTRTTWRPSPARCWRPPRHAGWRRRAQARADDKTLIDCSSVARGSVRRAPGRRAPSEGITANPANGDIYVGTFDVPSPANPNPKKQAAALSTATARWSPRSTSATRRCSVLGFDPANKHVYILNVGNFAASRPRIQRVAADLTGLTDVAIIRESRTGSAHGRQPGRQLRHDTFGPAPVCPMRMAFDSKGIFTYPTRSRAPSQDHQPGGRAPNCDVETFSHDPLLATAGFPAFAANGLAFTRTNRRALIANTGDDRVLKLDMSRNEKGHDLRRASTRGRPRFDQRGRLWVAANQADEVLALNAVGGSSPSSANSEEFAATMETPNGLLFPASPDRVRRHVRHEPRGCVNRGRGR